ncbi:hypothetical protein [Aureimonas sp. AU4]|uniref:hypothetical protein n=1 Tax=Aureimonas sp. AU4 TaxID=1638163 RepID=UPI0007858338|nr:hypothetical protein [Aureimonas sp. AU4]
MNAPPRTGFEQRFDLEPGEGDLVLGLLGPLLADLGESRVSPLLSAIRADRPLSEGLGLPPGAGEVLYARATQWFAVGRPEKAEPLFRILCMLDGASADHWVGHGVCLHLADRIEPARLAFETASRLRPGWAVPLFHLAALAVRERRWGDAVAALEQFGLHADADTPETMRREAQRLRTMADSAS